MDGYLKYRFIMDIFYASVLQPGLRGIKIGNNIYYLVIKSE
jgi:hypothetical protein